MFQAPEYVSPTTMKQITQYANMTSANFLNLPEILGTAITFATITNTLGHYDTVPFTQLRQHLEKSEYNFYAISIIFTDFKLN